MVTILVALVKMGALATIDAGSGAVFFGAVVVITIFVVPVLYSAIEERKLKYNRGLAEESTE